VSAVQMRCCSNNHVKTLMCGGAQVCHISDGKDQVIPPMNCIWYADHNEYLSFAVRVHTILSSSWRERSIAASSIIIHKLKYSCSHVILHLWHHKTGLSAKASSRAATYGSVPTSLLLPTSMLRQAPTLLCGSVTGHVQCL
jgi:hypothetical protein